VSQAAKYIVLAMVLACPGLSSVANGAEATELVTAFETMFAARLDTGATFAVDSLVLTHQDLTLVLRRGRLAFFEPVVIDSEQRVYAAYYDNAHYSGAGRFMFYPQVAVEKEQMQRFFRTDSLDRSFDKALLLFSSGLYDSIMAACQPTEHVFEKDLRRNAGSLYAMLTRDDNRQYMFEALSNLVHPGQRPFLLVNVEPDKSDPVFYIFNPNRREEVRFLKRFSELGGVNFMETVCRYSQYLDSAYININGLNKERIQIERYTIDAAIDAKADFEAATSMRFEVRVGPTRALRMELHRELVVDSILDSAGQRVAFVRYDKGEEKSESLYLFFDRPLNAGEVIILRFFYQGEITHREMGQCFVTAGGQWYPRYGYGQRALFTLNFKTPKRYAFVASGNLISEDEVADTILTTWKVVPPAKNISFNIGPLEKFTFEPADLARVDVYFSKDLHEELGRELSEEMVPTSRNVHNQVADDIINAMRLYVNFFGPYPYDRMTVGEILMAHGEAFPGFLHLGYYTWINTDSWGYDRVFRAHEVAHQWWGVTVGYETYHDQWLSEGLAEYSALMYLQAAAGNDMFLDRIKEYRNDIFSARQYLFGSGEEAGPIALGYRTASTKTRGDYRLIVYKKAALVVHMLRNLLIDLTTMKEDRFLNMMKDYYNSNRGSSVSTGDFQRLAEKHTGIDMGWFFDQWIYRSELPTYDFSYNFERDSAGTFTARCRVITTGVADNFQMYVPLEIDIDGENKAYVRIFIDRPDYEFTLPGLPQRPRELRLNPFESVLAKVKQ
jgi:hypothetical protein